MAIQEVRASGLEYLSLATELVQPLATLAVTAQCQANYERTNRRAAVGSSSRAAAPRLKSP
jgi:hypothetical protein